MTRGSLLAHLVADGKRIGAQAALGNEAAHEVIAAYAFWHRSSGDGMAQVLCEKAYDRWKQQDKREAIQ